MSDEQKTTLITWIIANIGLPLTPLGLKILISLFSNINITILDSIELILYSFFICIILTNMTSNKKAYGTLLRLLFIVICGADLIVMALIYVEIGNTACHIYALVMAIITPVFAISYKISEIKCEKEAK